MKMVINKMINKNNKFKNKNKNTLHLQAGTTCCSRGSAIVLTSLSFAFAALRFGETLETIRHTFSFCLVFAESLAECKELKSLKLSK